MNSALAALLGLTVAIILIVRKLSPVYALILGAVIGGLAAGWGLQSTVSTMIDGVKDITPAIVRIIAAGILTGMLVKTGAAQKISMSIIKGLGPKYIYLALALSALILTASGVFIDVAVITIAPIAILAGSKLSLSRAKLLLAMIGGGKCGNIISPNPNTIIAAENYGAPLSSVMAAGIIPAILALVVTVYLIIPLIPDGDKISICPNSEDEENLPGLWASLAGPLVAIILLALRPICGFAVDPLIALPVGGFVGIVTTGSWRKAGECIQYGLGKMSGIAVLLVGTGTIAGIIKVSAIKDVLVGMLGTWDSGAMLLAPISGTLMCAASASTTAGATIASASFAQTVLGTGVSAIWAAAMTNAGATVLDHLPHGSFFHASSGSVGMDIKERLKLIPFETLTGLALTVFTVIAYMMVR